MKNQLINIPLGKITPSPNNPRHVLANDPTVAELAKSIEASGLLQPVVCRPQGDGFELLAGRRRFEAHRLLKRDTILAIVRELTDAQAIEVTVLENLQRQNLTPLEEARGVKSLLDTGHDPRAIAADIGKSVQWVYRRAKLVDLIPAFVKAFEDPLNDWHKATAVHLELIARLPGSRQEAVLGHKWLADRSLKELENHLAQHEHALRAAPWADEEARNAEGGTGKVVGGCAQCQKRSSVQPELFHDTTDTAVITKQDRCLDPDCWGRKQQAFIERRKVELDDTAIVPVLMVHGVGAECREQEANKGALDNWDYERCKKSTPGAKKALVVDGKDAGKELWIKTRAGANTTGGKTKMPPLALRRKAHVIRTVAKALEKSESPWSAVLTAAVFALHFGTIRNQDRESRSQEWDDCEVACDAPQSMIIDGLWKAVRPVFARRLRFFDVSSCEPAYNVALRVAKLIQLKCEDLDATAEAAFPGKGASETRKSERGTRKVKKGGKS